MVKMGRLLEGLHLMCLSHGLHLAVVDVMYKMPENLQHQVTSKGNKDESEDSSEDDSENEAGNPHDDSITGDEDDEGLRDRQMEEDMVLVSEIDMVVKKIRKICRKFKKSPLLNDALLKYIRQDLPGMTC